MDSIRKLLSRKFDNHLFENGRSPGLRLVAAFPSLKNDSGMRWQQAFLTIRN